MNSSRFDSSITSSRSQRRLHLSENRSHRRGHPFSHPRRRRPRQHRRERTSLHSPPHTHDRSFEGRPGLAQSSSRPSLRQQGLHRLREHSNDFESWRHRSDPRLYNLERWSYREYRRTLEDQSDRKEPDRRDHHRLTTPLQPASAGREPELRHPPRTAAPCLDRRRVRVR